MNGADACAITRAADVRSLLLDPAEVTPLRRELSRLLEDGYALGVLTLRRAKFKPGRKLTAYYGATVSFGVDRGTREVAVIRSVGAADRIPAEPGDVAPIEAEAAERGLMAPFRSLDSRLPAQHVRVLVAPLDPTFPHLVRLSDPAIVGQLLRVAGGRVSVAALRYRPGQRHVLSYVVRGGDGCSGSAPVFAKLCAKGDEARALRREGALAEWLEGAGAHVAAVAPLDGISERGVLFYPHAGGVPLERELGRLREAGAALRTLHRAPPGLVEAPDPSSLADEARAVGRAVEHIDVLLPPAADRIRRLLDRAQDVYSRLSRGDPTVIHGDFKLDHLRWASGRIVLIDLDRCRIADPAFDLGKLLADLHWWHEQTGAVDFARAGREFLDGYFGGDGSLRRVRARVFEAVLLAKIAARRVPLESPRWPVRVDSLVGRAEAVLAAVEHDCNRSWRVRPRVRGVAA